MIKTYNLIKLLRCDEFDAQKCYARYGSKEAFFTVLSRFTEESEKITGGYRLDELSNSGFDPGRMTDDIEKLQRLLADIGATDLIRDVQNLDIYIRSNDNEGYLNRLAKIFSDVGRLRARIINAEKAESGNEPSHDWISSHAKARRDRFERLLPLVDNFELGVAAETVNSLMKYSYTPEIDELLNVVFKALGDLDSDTARSKMKELFDLVASIDDGSETSKKHILMIDDMPDVLRTVKAMLKDKYTVYGVTNYSSAIKFLSGNTADLILLDIEMPGLDGFDILRMLRNLPGYADTPIVFLTSNVSAENIKAALSMGASDFIKKPFDLAILTAKVEKALLNRQRGAFMIADEYKARILIADGERASFLMLLQALASEYTISAVNSGKSMIEKAHADMPDLILLDTALPDMSGHDVLSRLKESSETRDIPVILISGSANAGDEVTGLALGAADYITKPLNMDIVRARVKMHLQLMRQMRSIEKLGMIDLLTSMPNRRRFDMQIEAEWGRTIRERTVISLLILDIDGFNSFNDMYGHPMGDALLQALAKTLLVQAKRPADLAARFGGDEFAYLLPNTDQNGAMVVGENIRAAVEALAIPGGINPNFPVTVSIGAASAVPDNTAVLSDFITLCEKNLDTARESGGNKLCGQALPEKPR